MKFGNALETHQGRIRDAIRLHWGRIGNVLEMHQGRIRVALGTH